MYSVRAFFPLLFGETSFKFHFRGFGESCIPQCLLTGRSSILDYVENRYVENSSYVRSQQQLFLFNPTDFI
jgi:hypothetical protein